MNEVLYKLCCLSCSWCFCGRPIPSTVLSEALGMSLYKVRKELKSLKTKGLINSTIQVMKDEYGNYILRGYELTEKGRQTEEYKKACEEMNK